VNALITRASIFFARSLYKMDCRVKPDNDPGLWLNSNRTHYVAAATDRSPQLRVRSMRTAMTG
jgi:hypothetical protein